MSILQAEDIRELSYEQMQEKLDELRQELFTERSKIASGGAPENPGRLKELRRTIARVKTIMNEVAREGGG